MELEKAEQGSIEQGQVEQGSIESVDDIPLDDVPLWERQAGEPSKLYSSFHQPF